MNIYMSDSEMKIIDNGSVASPLGYKTAGVHCGLKKKRKDLGIIISEVPAVCAAVYTTNTFQAAPLQVTKKTLKDSSNQRAIIINSGNANAFTGEKGLEDVYSMQSAVAKEFNFNSNEVLVASTGIIGEKLPIEKILAGINKLPSLVAQETDGFNFSEAILTTDTFTKSIAIQLKIDNKKVTIGGTAKGSGMIHPNMATMLAFITTDANIEKETLQKLLKISTDESFNMITVDGDTSTNDMVIVMANGLASNNLLDENHSEWELFYYGFSFIAKELAKMIAQDGEGATKLITVHVNGADDREMANKISKMIVGSNLVKTAIFGADANWGRIVMAIGNSGYDINYKLLDIAIGNIKVVYQGIPAIYDENEAKKALLDKEVTITVNLNIGDAYATAWGCDLSYEYVRINGSYRT